MYQAIRSKKLASVSSVRMDQAIRSNKLASVWRARVIRSKKVVSRSNGLSYLFKSAVRSYGSSYPFKKKSSAFGTVQAVPFKKIHHLFQLSVGKNKTVVTSSFHWKVKYCRGMSQLRSTQLFTHAKTFHRVFMVVDCNCITSWLIYDNKIFCTTLFETPLH